MLGTREFGGVLLLLTSAGATAAFTTMLVTAIRVATTSTRVSLAPHRRPVRLKLMESGAAVSRPKLETFTVSSSSNPTRQAGGPFSVPRGPVAPPHMRTTGRLGIPGRRWLNQRRRVAASDNGSLGGAGSCPMTQAELQEMVNRLGSHRCDNFDEGASFVRNACPGGRSRVDDSTSGWRVMVLSASFNPPTLAHCGMCAMAAARQGIVYDEVVLVLATNNVDKAVTGASLVQRLQMMCGLTAEELGLGEDEASNLPVSVVATSFGRFADKSMALNSLYSHTSNASGDGQQQVEFDFLMGYDTAIRLFDGKYYQDGIAEALGPFFRRCSVTVFSRGQDGQESLEQMLASADVQPFADRIDLVFVDDAAMLDTSSTRVREALAAQDLDAAASLLPPSVIETTSRVNIYGKRP